MYCIKCGKEISGEDNVCLSCQSLESSNNSLSNNSNNIIETESDRKNANLVCIISLVCTFGA